MQPHIDEYIQFKTGGKLKKASAQSYLNVLNKFNLIVRKPLEELVMGDIIKFRTIIADRYSPKSLEHHLNILHTFIKFWNPEVKTISHERIEVTSAKSNPHATILESEHQQLLAQLDPYNFSDIQKRLFLNLLWDTGARSGELMTINLEDLDFDNRRVRIDTEKTKKERVLFWSEETHQTLCRYLPIRWEIKRSNALFVGLYANGEYSPRLNRRTTERWVRVLCRKAGIIRKIVPHSYRHSRIQRWISSGLDLITVSYLSGHESTTSLEHYMRLGVEEIQLKAKRAM